MAEINKIRFLIFVSLMIFPVRALDVILSGAHEKFKQKSEMNIDIVEGEKIYRGTLNKLSYEARNGTSKVIVYIISRSRCIEILRPTGVARETRSEIARELREMHCEILFLGIEHFDDDEYHLIGAFIFDKIRRHPDQKDFNIKTIGENRFDQCFRCSVRIFEKYRENAQICGGSLLARLRAIPHGAIRPVGRNNKEIKLWGYRPIVGEVSWSVHVENNTYVPNVDLSDPKYNFMIKYPGKKICLLLLSGKVYSEVTKYGKRCSQRAATKELIDEMKKNGEVLIIMGAFNFDWTEVDIVTQIILRHSEGLDGLDCNVFICGYGMFNTYYLYDYEGRGQFIRQQPNSYVSEVIKLLMGEEVKERAINVGYDDGEWKCLNIIINTGNGRYFPELGFINSTLPCLHPKIAFIVYDRAEMNVPVDYLAASEFLEELERSNISVVLIEAINFGLDDIHIIAEWIDCHSGPINLEQIAVLGGGIFDTIFQSESTTYNAFLNTKKYELESIRNAYVMSGNEKSVSVANIDDFSEFEVWSYPMNTLVNGFYEPDLIPDKNLIDTSNGRKTYFIITSANTFQKMLSLENFRSLISSFRRNVNPYYPQRKWSVFLVGLDNFGERDSHLFAELVKRQTYGRFFGEYFRTFNYDTSQAIYQYKDFGPFDFDPPRTPIDARFVSIFGMDLQPST